MHAKEIRLQSDHAGYLGTQQALDLLDQMTLPEKIGQMSQLNGGGGFIPQHIADGIRAGQIGSILNEVDVSTVNELQRLAVEESRLGIPLLIGRDVIHGFKTIFPIPLGLAATWEAEIVERGAAVGAAEAAAAGVNWTFAPMIDITRDPRWGRVAESLGEDPLLCSELGVAMIKGFQGSDLSRPGKIASCAKHFAGYGAAEGGRDYATASVPEVEMRNVYLRPFKAASDSGVATFMTAFCELNGIPASGNQWLMNQVLRQEWGFDGMVVSDWASIVEMSVHGFTEDDRDSALRAVMANVDMEMATDSYRNNLEELVSTGELAIEQIDRMVLRILDLKIELGLFENPYTDSNDFAPAYHSDHLDAAREAAIKSCVLLKNHNSVLPIEKNRVRSVAVMGPLADDGYEQMGTWVFDGEAEHSITCLQAIKNELGDAIEVCFDPVLDSTRAASADAFGSAKKLAQETDLTILVLGEESFMSGEAHSRADIGLPGYQEALVEAIADTGKPLVVVIMAGRPLTLENVVDKADAVLYAWHPGTMGGPAVSDLLFGAAIPSGKLPISFPRHVGQVPIYYSQKNTGRPASEETMINFDSVEQRAPQTSLGMSSFHLDAGHRPLFPFGYGLSYSRFEYQNIELSSESMTVTDSMIVSADVENCGEYLAEEVVQLYIRDLVGSITRPVRELKGFKRVKLKPGECQKVSFRLSGEDLGFYDNQARFLVEPGRFHVWIGGDSDADLQAEFQLHSS